MLPNMKFYVVSIVAIFTALGLGIYIGFSMDTEGFITDQQEELVNIVESEFESIIKENIELVAVNDSLLNANDDVNRYIDESYKLLVPEKLAGLNIGLIESNKDYVSSIGHDLEKAGANIVNLSNLSGLDKKEDIDRIVNVISKGQGLESVQDLVDGGLLETLGNYNIKADYIVLCGGSRSEKSSRVSLVDKKVIEVCNNLQMPIIGLEKSYVKNSYINKYKEYGIATVDNIDMKMGKIATVLALNSARGNYGIKGSAESILPVK